MLNKEAGDHQHLEDHTLPIRVWTAAHWWLCRWLTSPLQAQKTWKEEKQICWFWICCTVDVLYPCYILASSFLSFFVHPWLCLLQIFQPPFWWHFTVPVYVDLEWELPNWQSPYSIPSTLFSVCPWMVSFVLPSVEQRPKVIYTRYTSGESLSTSWQHGQPTEIVLVSNF